MTFIKGVICGAALMYFLDPDRGRSRRAYVRDRSVRFRNELARRSRGRMMDARNRVHGTIAEMRRSGRGRRHDLGGVAG
jgi:hypothetical protein